MRNRLVRGYFTIGLRLLWDTVQKDIPERIARLESTVPQDWH